MEKKTLAYKLLEVKKKVPFIKKETSGYKYKYADPETVLGTMNPLLNEAGLFLQTEITGTKTERVNITDKNGVHEESLFVIEMLFTWIDVETGERLPTKWSSSGVNGDEKGLGSALTYAERYFMLKTFNIATGEDDPDAKQDDKKSVAVTKPKSFSI